MSNRDFNRVAIPVVAIIYIAILLLTGFDATAVIIGGIAVMVISVIAGQVLRSHR